ARWRSGPTGIASRSPLLSGSSGHSEGGCLRAIEQAGAQSVRSDGASIVVVMAEQVLYRRPSLLLFALEIPRATADAAVLGPAWPPLRLAPHGDGHPVLTLPGFCGSLPTGWRSRRAR